MRLLHKKLFAIFFSMASLSLCVHGDAWAQSGDEQSRLEIDLLGCNSTFYFEGLPIEYTVRVGDQDDGNNIASEVTFTAYYLDDGYAFVAAMIPPKHSLFEQKVDQVINKLQNMPGGLPSLPLAGTYELPETSPYGVVVIHAAHSGDDPVEQTFVLRNSTVEIASGLLSEGITQLSKSSKSHGQAVVNSSGSYIKFPDTDLTGLAEIRFLAKKPLETHGQGGIIEVRIDSPDGPVIGTTEFIDSPTLALFTAPIEAVTGKYDVFFVFKNDGAVNGDLLMVNTAEFVSSRSLEGEGVHEH